MSSRKTNKISLNTIHSRAPERLCFVVIVVCMVCIIPHVIWVQGKTLFKAYFMNRSGPFCIRISFLKNLFSTTTVMAVPTLAQVEEACTGMSTNTGPRAKCHSDNGTGWFIGTQGHNTRFCSQQNSSLRGTVGRALEHGPCWHPVVYYFLNKNKKKLIQQI